MQRFTSKTELGVNFYDAAEGDLFVDCWGYNDFHAILPIKTPHFQNTYTIHFVLSGRGYLHIGDTRYTVKENDMFFIPPNTQMYYYPEERDPWSYVWVSFTGEKAALYGELFGFSESPVHAAQNPEGAYRVASAIFSRLDAGESIGYYAAVSAFYALLDLEKEKTEKEESLSARVNAYLGCHYHRKDLSVADVCRDFHISHAYLCRVYKEETGKTVKGALGEMRIAAAKHLLLDRELTVASVAYSVGFSDNLHFMKAFKAATGVTAGEYRKNGAS